MGRAAEKFHSEFDAAQHVFARDIQPAGMTHQRQIHSPADSRPIDRSNQRLVEIQQCLGKGCGDGL